MHGQPILDEVQSSDTCVFLIDVEGCFCPSAQFAGPIAQSVNLSAHAVSQLFIANRRSADGHDTAYYGNGPTGRAMIPAGRRTASRQEPALHRPPEQIDI
jgi:hypothetical protein